MSSHFHSHGDGSVSLVANGELFRDRLRHYFQYLFRESPHYRAVMEQNGLSPAHDPLEVLGGFPVTTKADYRDVLQLETLSRLNSGDFVCDYSSGSTAGCVLRLATPIDELGEQAITEQVFQRAGMRRGDTFVCMEVGVPEIYDFYFRAARRLGVQRTSYLHLTSDYARCLQPLGPLTPNFLLTLPSVLVRAWPSIRRLWPHGKSPIRSMMHMGEPIHPDFRQEVMDVLGCHVYSFYGTTETGGMAGECAYSCGGHFDPELICPTIRNPQIQDDHTVEGEILLTTCYIRYQSVVKYEVGDIVQVTTEPCECGEMTPRLTIKERTHDSFILTGVKFRYETILEAVQKVAPDLTFLAITLDDLPDAEGHTLMRLDVPKACSHLEDQLLQALQYDVFELDDVFQFGMVRFQLNFLHDDEFDERKIRRVVDNRQYMST